MIAPLQIGFWGMTDCALSDPEPRLEVLSAVIGKFEIFSDYEPFARYAAITVPRSSGLKPKGPSPGL
jgi:hypothetical protein